MKKVIAALAVAMGLTLIGVTQASATSFTPPDISGFCSPVTEVRPNPDYTAERWQHYSWTGGPRDVAPPFPGEGWNPNNDKAPKDVQEGVYKKGPGKGSWFYWEYIPSQGEPTIIVQTGEVCDLWVTWKAPGYYPNATNASNVGWPQAFVGLGQIKPTTCSTTYQQDRYVGQRSVIDGILADGILTNNGGPEDSSVVTEWKFKHSKPCPVPVALTTPALNDLCGWSGDEYALPESTPGVTYTRDGRDIVATVSKGYVLSGLPEGWVATDAGAVYPFNADLFDSTTPCDEQPPADREERVGEGAPVCTANTVTTWAEERTRDYSYDPEGETWVAGEWSEWEKVKGSESTRQVTPEEQAELKCPTPDKPTPGLADTGASGATPWVATGSGLLMALGTALLWLRRKAVI